MRLISEPNNRDHRWAKQKRKVGVRETTTLIANTMWTSCKVYGITPPFQITLTRIGPKKLDPDNLAASFKAVQDSVARSIGIDDGDDRMNWIYAQEKRAPKEYGVRIRIEAAHGKD